MHNDFSLEILRFRTRLKQLGLPEDKISQMVEELKHSVGKTIDSALSEGMTEAVSIGVTKKAEDFIADLRPSPERFEIVTLSGRTDYTVQPFSMRPGLLKNAKMSKDGVAYKVIPVGKKSVDNSTSRMLSLDNVQKYLATEQKQTLRDRLASRGLGKSGHQDFKTVTNNQDPNSWIHPGFQRDFTEDLKSINDMIKARIEGSFKSIMEEMELKAWNDQSNEGDY